MAWADGLFRVCSPSAVGEAGVGEADGLGEAEEYMGWSPTWVLGLRRGSRRV